MHHHFSPAGGLHSLCGCAAAAAGAGRRDRLCEEVRAGKGIAGGGGQSFERPPPSPAAVRGDGLAALPGGAQRGRGSGPGGLQINEPGISRSLKTLTGSWSELALACLIHVGMKRLMPNEDSGLGIGAEYEEAVRLHRAGGKTR